MRIALVRGPSLNPYEMQNEVPLLPRFSLTAFATTYSPEWDNRLPQLPVDYSFWPDTLLSHAPKLRWLFNGLCSRFLGISFYMPGLEKKLKPFSIIHTLETHNTYSFQAAKAAKANGRKLVVTVWETIPKRGESHPLRAARKRAVLAQTDAFIAVTPRAARMLQAEGVSASKIQIIPMGIDQTHFRPFPADQKLRASWNAEPDEFIWLCVARLVYEKGISDVLEAFAKVASSSRLVFVGRGPDQKHFERQARQFGIREKVVFAGAYPYAQMPSIYTSANALVLASRPTDWWEEQFGYCLVEAMACGLPIVAAHSGAIPEVIGNAGLLVSPNNPLQLAEAMTNVKRDAALRESLIQEGFKRAQTEFSHLGTADKIGRLYTSLT